MGQSANVQHTKKGGFGDEQIIQNKLSTKDNINDPNDLMHYKYHRERKDHYI